VLGHVCAGRGNGTNPLAHPRNALFQMPLIGKRPADEDSSLGGMHR
jgi:hypothetical protein